MERATPLIATWILTCLALGACGGSSTPQSTVTLPPPPPPPPPPPSSDATLGALGVSTGSLDQLFESGTKDYTGTTSYLGMITRVSATANDANATVSINGDTPTTGSASADVSLISGSNMVTMTVLAEDGVSGDSYTLDLTRADASGLNHIGYIKASNTEIGDGFGGAVAIDGDTFAVGATREDSAAAGINGDESDNAAVNAGAVYVFHKDAAGTWAQEAFLKGSTPGAGHAFGHAIALSGDTLAVSAPGEDSSATGIDGDETDTGAQDSGAVYVFVRDSTGIWTQQAYIKASNTAAFDGFGTALALDGDTLAVGAHLEDSAATGVDGDDTDDTSADAGAVYVFTRDVGGAWTQQAYIKASNTDPGDVFGQTVALSADTLVVGAPGESSRASGIDGNENQNNDAGAGAAYVFVRDAMDVWTQQAYVKASNTDAGDEFGTSISLDDDTLVVGAPREDSGAVGVNGFENDDRTLNAGAAYVFVRDEAGDWSQQAYIKASNSGSEDRFGSAIVNNGEFLAVSAREDSSATNFNGDQADNTMATAGAVYLYERDLAGVWVQTSYIKAPNTAAADNFGYSLALTDAALLIGADLEDSVATGIGGDMSDDTSLDAGAVYFVR